MDERKSRTSGAVEAAARFFAASPLVGGGRPGGRVVAEPVGVEGGLLRVRVAEVEPVSVFTSRWNARTGEPISWFFDLLMEGPGRDLPEAVCLAAAERAAAPPPDAVLERAGYEDVGGMPVFVARWRHEHDGVPVDGDLLFVQVNGRTGEVFAVDRRWHRVDEAPGPR